VGPSIRAANGRQTVRQKDSIEALHQYHYHYHYHNHHHYY